MKRLFLFLVLCTVLGSVALAQTGTRYYVSTSGTPNGNALSWATACSDLQLVINNAQSGDTVWVAQGRYVPVRPMTNLNIVDSNNRLNAFVLKTNVFLYGGFSGVETQLSQRILPPLGTVNGSVLSGNIGDPADSTDNAYHVVVYADISADINAGPAYIDGFSLTEGYANGNFASHVNGAQVVCVYGAGLFIDNAYIIINNINIIGNASRLNGGGVCIRGGNYLQSITCNNVYIAHNIAYSNRNNEGQGGGIYIDTRSTLNDTSGATLLFNNVVLTHNHAHNLGGGLYMEKKWFHDFQFRNMTVTHNTADRGGGGMANVRSSTLTNVLIAYNKAAINGGAMLIVDDGTAYLNHFTNVSICNNMSPLGSIYIYFSASHSYYFRNSIIWGNTLPDSITPCDAVFGSHGVNVIPQNSIIRGLPLGNGITQNTDPLFADAAHGDFRLTRFSPAINAGDNSFYSAGSTPDISSVTTDLDGNPRFFNNGRVDMGCYEYQHNPITPDSNGILYVNKYVPAGGDSTGRNWANALVETAEALYAAHSNDSIKEIWVAEAEYNPLFEVSDSSFYFGRRGDVRKKAFRMEKDVKLYGGFPAFANDTDHAPHAGLSMADARNTRNWDLYPTILSGNTGDPSDSTDNVYHVLVSVGDVGTASLDGFVVCGGFADSNASMQVLSAAVANNNGGGLYTVGSSPSIKNVIFRNNTAKGSGGGLYNSGSSLTLTRVNIENNKSGMHGGGLYNNTGVSDTMTLTYVNINGNTAGGHGGGMYNHQTNVNMSDVNINDNIADTGNGGGMYCGDSCYLMQEKNIKICRNKAPVGSGGGMYHSRTNMYLTNALVVNNTAGLSGGAVSSEMGFFFLTNVTFGGNRSSNGVLYNESGTRTYLRNSILWGNTDLSGTVSSDTVFGANQGLNRIYFYNTLVKDAPLGNGIILNTDPEFIDASKGDYHLHPYSEAIDAGDNSFYSAGSTPNLSTVTTDLDGNPRFVHDTVDLGAYESPFKKIRPDGNGIVYVNRQVSTGNGRGNSWYNAVKELSDALSYAPYISKIKEIWVAEAEYVPLNLDTGLSWKTEPNRNNAFILRDSIAVYGGFPAFANDTDHAPHAGLSIDNARNTRNWDLYPVILDGKKADPTDPLGALGGAYHVVVVADTGSTSVLDGFTIRGGNANGNDSLPILNKFICQQHGGGIYNHSPFVTFSNLKIESNSVSGLGGGIFNADSSSPQISYTEIFNNTALQGGGLYNGKASAPTLTNVIIRSNQAQQGGGFFNNLSSNVFDRVEIVDNRASQSGGGMYSLHNGQTTSAGIYTNCLFVKNVSAVSGGALYYNDGQGAGVVFTNSTFVEDSSLSGNLLYYYKDESGSPPLFRNSIIDNSVSGSFVDGYNADVNSLIFAYTLTPRSSLGSHPQNRDNILSEDPLFLGKAGGNFRIHPNSPAVNKGNKAYYETDSVPDISYVLLDLDQRQRFNSADVDLGCYEHQIVLPDLEGIVYVNKQIKGGNGTGENWANAAYEVADALYAARNNSKIKEIWVAESVYTPFYHASDDSLYDGGSKNAFVLPDSVGIYGGFPFNANDTANAPHAGLLIDDARNTRNRHLYPTVLSGYVTRGGKVYDTAYHVIISAGDVGTTRLDGFTLQYGNANGTQPQTVNGIAVLPFHGGGIYTVSSSPLFADIIMENNAARQKGGGVYTSVNSAPTFVNILFINNKSDYGGAMYNDTSSPLLINTTFSNNRVRTNGGAIYNHASSPKIRNSIIWGNTLDNNLTINNIYNNNSYPVHAHTLQEGATLGNGIIRNTDPLFVDVLHGDYRLSYCSPAINTGNNAYYHADSIPNISHIIKDLDNNARIYNGETVDLGAYEFQQPRVIPKLSLGMQDTSLCYRDSIDIPFTLTGTPPWDLVYTTHEKTHYDTIRSISNTSHFLRVSPLDTTTYYFVHISDLHCDTVINDSITIRVVQPFGLDNVFFNDTLCHNEQTAGMVFSGFATDYLWSVSNPIAGLPTTPQTHNFGNYTLTNNGNSVQTATVTVTPVYNQGNMSCNGIDSSFYVTVLPYPVILNIPANDTLCDEDTTTPTVFNGVATSYHWQLSTLGDSISGLPLGNRSGNFGSYLLQNKTDNPQTSIIQAVPKYAYGTKICLGTDTSFSVTLLPNASIRDTLANDTLCHLENTIPISFTGAYTNISWSLSSHGDTVGGLSPFQTGNFGIYTLENTTPLPQTSVIEIVSYYAMGSKRCYGDNENFSISVLPNILISNIPAVFDTLCDGEHTTPIVFNGVATSYHWQLSTLGDSISGLPLGNRSGNFGSYLLQNKTNAVQTSVIEVIPSYSFGTKHCVGNDTTFLVTVNPQAYVSNIPEDYFLCNGGTSTPVNFLGVSTLCQWEVQGDHIDSLPTGIQNGNFGEYTLYNYTNSTKTAVIHVIPYYNSANKQCQGIDTSFSITVAPPVTVAINIPAVITYCHGEKTDSITFEGTLDYCTWEASNALGDIPLGLQTGNFGQYALINETASPLSTTINITPYYSINTLNCQGKDTSFVITVNPKPMITSILTNDTLCDGEKTKNIHFDGIATEYQWTATGMISGMPTGIQTGDFGMYTLSNTNTVSENATVYVTPRYIAGGKTCTGETQSFYVTVHPDTEIKRLSTAKRILCEGEELLLQAEAKGGEIVYQWFFNDSMIANTTEKQYSIYEARKYHSGNYHVEADGYCGISKSPAVTIDVRSDSMLVEKWHDVIFVDNSKEKYAAYQWYKNGIRIPNATEQFYQELGGLNGCYHVRLTLVNGKRELSCERCLDKTDKALAVYPNPVKAGEPLRIVYHEGNNSEPQIVHLEMYSMDGKWVFSEQMQEGEYEISTQGLSQGVYIIRLSTQNKENYYKKIAIY